jgi:hypothetical protein
MIIVCLLSLVAYFKGFKHSGSMQVGNDTISRSAGPIDGALVEICWHWNVTHWEDGPCCDKQSNCCGWARS